MILRHARDRRRAAALLASLVAHAGVVALLASVAPRLVLTQGRPEPLQVRLVAAPAEEATSTRPALAEPVARAPAILRGERLAPRPVPPTRLPSSPAPRARIRAPSPFAKSALPAQAPGGGLAAGAAAGSAGATSQGSGPRADGGDAQGAARALVRNTVGCDHETWLRLSPAERERCNSPFLEGMRSGLHIDALPADKRADFDRQAAADSRKRAYQEGPVYNPVTACAGAGSNYGTGCLADDAVKHLRPK